MTLTARDLVREAAATGFPAETLEKVIRILGLLNALWSHPYLRPRVALKGGTAINLFVFNVPRLSVDIDLNYIGAVDRDTMVAERPKVEQAVEAVCSREGLDVRHVPSGHAGGKWRLRYASTTGQGGNLEVDLNFILRLPLLPREIEFIERLNDRGEIVPELLTRDLAMQGVIRRLPALQWKALNVRKYNTGLGV